MFLEVFAFADKYLLLSMLLLFYFDCIYLSNPGSEKTYNVSNHYMVWILSSEEL